MEPIIKITTSDPIITKISDMAYTKVYTKTTTRIEDVIETIDIAAEQADLNNFESQVNTQEIDLGTNKHTIKDKQVKINQELAFIATLPDVK